MKNLILSLIILVFSIASLSAQREHTFKKLFEEMERMQREMLQDIAGINPDSLGFQLYFDTLLIQDYGDLFGPLDGNGMQPFDERSFEELLQRLQKESPYVDQTEWGELFEWFGIFPLVPMQNAEPQEGIKSDAFSMKKDGSKRKIYKM